MGIKDALLAKKMQEAVDNDNHSEFFELVSQNEELAERFLNEFVDSDNFVQGIKEAMDGWKKILDNNQLANSEVAKMLLETRTGLQKYLDENIDKLSREERQETLNRVMELARMMMEVDKENKSFLLKFGGLIATSLVMIGVAAVAILSPKQDVIDMAEDENE